jgi:hypothetical protein
MVSCLIYFPKSLNLAKKQATQKILNLDLHLPVVALGNLLKAHLAAIYLILADKNQFL